MRAFVAYRHRGADLDQLRPMLTAVKAALEAQGVEIFNTFFDVLGGDTAEPELGPEDFMREGFSMLDRSDVLVVLQAEESRSEGMLMEVGYAIGKGLPLVVATKDSVRSTYLPAMAAVALRWYDLDDLVAKLRAVKFSALQGQ